MAVDLSKHLVIGVSSRALFDMSEANKVFMDYGSLAYTRYQLQREHIPLEPGTGFPLIKSILEFRKKSNRRRAEVILMSHNSPSASLRIFNSIQHYGLDIPRAALTSGANLAPYLAAFNVHLFLSAHEQDVRDALKAGVAAGLIYEGSANTLETIDQIRIALDADAVVFSGDSQRVYDEKGLEAFCEHERRLARLPLQAGPFARLLKALSVLQNDPSFDKPPVYLALVTARNMPAHELVIRTLRSWGARIDEAFFLGGVAKTKILQAFKPHIFFDDQAAHCEPASAVVPTARVPIALPVLAQRTVPSIARPALRDIRREQLATTAS